MLKTKIASSKLEKYLYLKKCWFVRRDKEILNVKNTCEDAIQDGKLEMSWNDKKCSFAIDIAQGMVRHLFLLVVKFDCMY